MVPVEFSIPMVPIFLTNSVGMFMSRYWYTMSPLLYRIAWNVDLASGRFG